MSAALDELNYLVTELRDKSGRDYRIAFSRSGRKAWINEVLEEDELNFVSVTDPMYLSQLVAHLKKFHESLSTPR